ncbi:Hypothetical short-chain dehydrogenase/reductase [Mycobacteroides abscessus subsp. abscessus]|nr:Hypothetical short-chain dehydrogenase/reductase [Mycobacteroides abscessus subsp. abscessus]
MGSTANGVAGKTVMITGGAGGIGVEVAHRLYAKGANVVLTDLDEAKLAAIADELGGDRVLVAVADVCDLTTELGGLVRARPARVACRMLRDCAA